MQRGNFAAADRKAVSSHEASSQKKIIKYRGKYPIKEKLGLGRDNTRTPPRGRAFKKRKGEGRRYPATAAEAFSVGA